LNREQILKIRAGDIVIPVEAEKPERPKNERRLTRRKTDKGEP